MEHEFIQRWTFKVISGLFLTSVQHWLCTWPPQFPYITWELLKALIPPHISFPSLFLPRLLVCLLLILTLISSPFLMGLLAFTAFSKCHQRSCHSPVQLQVEWNKGKHFTGPSGACQTSWYIQLLYFFLHNEVCIAQSDSSSLYQLTTVQ